MIADETGIVLPPSAVVDKYEEPQSSINRLWAAKVQIPEASYPELKKSILETKGPDTYSIDKSGLPQSISWWKPVDIEFKHEFQPHGSDLAVEVVASKENGKRVLYIYGVP